MEYYVGEEIENHLSNIHVLLQSVMPEENFKIEDLVSKENPEAMRHILIYKDVFEGVEKKPFLRELIGYICYIDYTTFYYLMVIGVKKEYQGKGIGKMLFEELKNRNMDKKSVWCKIHRKNEMSKCFFKKNGFHKKWKREIPKELNRCYRKPYDGYEFY